MLIIPNIKIINKQIIKIFAVIFVKEGLNFSKNIEGVIKIKFTKEEKFKTLIKLIIIPKEYIEF